MIAALDRLWARLRASFTKPELDQDFDEELALHLDMLTEENIRSGQTPEAARRRAKQQMGGIEQTRELHRETRGIPWFEQLGRDLKFTARLLRRERGFALIAILLVALGIGLNTTVFSLVNTVLLRPLPYPDSERFVWIANGDLSNPNPTRTAHTVDTWEGLQEINTSLDAIEAYNPFSLRQTFRLTGTGDPQTINSIMVSHGLFSLLGIKPIHGRLFLPGDAITNGPRVTLLSHQIWQRVYGADPAIVGRTIYINETPVQVLGILPPADAFTTSFYPATRVDIFEVIVNDNIRDWDTTLSLIGRREKGNTAEQVSADLNRSIAQLQEQYPDRGDHYVANTMSLHDYITKSLKQPLVFLWVAAGLVLAIVGFNLGGLLLARSVARRKEIALRSTLGASRGRLLRQLMTETAALVSVGSILGVVLTAFFIHYLSTLSTINIPLLQTVRLDSTSLGFTLLLCVATAVLFGIAPAWSLSSGRADKSQALKEEGRSATANRGLVVARSSLVTLEVALACTLAISAGLMITSFRNVMKVDLGYQPENLVAVRIDPLADGDRFYSHMETLLDKARSIPGVTFAGMTDCIPVERNRRWGFYTMDDPNVDEPQEWDGAALRIISPGLFEAMGIRLIEGRYYSRLEEGGADTEDTIIINQTLARKYWPNSSALNRFLSVRGRSPSRIIGIVEDVRHNSPEIEPGNEMYLSYYYQRSSSWDLMIRTTLPLNQIASDLRQALHEVDPALPLSEIRHVQTLVDRATSSRKLMMKLVGGFAALALVLAALGLYGVISYTVSQRSKEIGVRMALGASSSTVQREVVAHTIKLTAIGLIIGIVASTATGRFLQSLLFNTNANNLGIYASVFAAILICSFAAGYLPARRASKIEPMDALRAE